MLSGDTIHYKYLVPDQKSMSFEVLCFVEVFSGRIRKRNKEGNFLFNRRGENIKEKKKDLCFTLQNKVRIYNVSL